MAARRKRRRAKKRKINWAKVRTVAAWSGLVLGSYELYYATVLRKQRRRDAFNAALQRKTATGKRLLVVGDPKRGLARVLGADFDCADGCVPLEEAALLPPNSAVVFIADGQLERADDARDVWLALQQASGGDVFVAPFGRWSALAWLPGFGRKRVLYAAPPAAGYLEYRDLPWTPGRSERVRVAGLRLVG